MTANPLEVQSQIMHNSNTIRKTIQDIQEWEKDMKREEQKRLAENEVSL